MSIKVKFRLLILLLGTLTFFSCSASKYHKSTKGYIANDKSFNLDLNRIVESISINDSLIKLLNQKNLYYNELLTELDNEVNSLRSKIGNQDSANSKIYLSLLDIENNLSLLSTTYNEIAQVSSINKIKEIPPISGEDFRDKYIESLALYQNGEWEKSLEGFKYLLTIGMDNDLLDNCQYWLGEIYYKLKKYHFAIEEFEKVFLYNDSNKKDDALYKLSKSYSYLGDEVNSRRVLLELIDNYHNSEYVKTAKELLK